MAVGHLLLCSRLRIGAGLPATIEVSVNQGEA